MPSRSHVIAEARRILKTADAAEAAVATAPPARRPRSHTADAGLESMLGTAPPPIELASPLDRAVAEERDRRLQDGVRAMRKLDSGRDDQISHDEQRGLEAIVLLSGRPAILIQEGDFLDPPAQWTSLKGLRAEITSAISRVGRIEVAANPNFDWLGTGFLAGADTVITNRHVAMEFAKGPTRGKWTFRAPMTARLDFKEELGGAQPFEFDLTGIVGIHETHDLAVLKIARISAAGSLPDPLPVAAKAPATTLVGRKVYVVGYPAWDGRRNDPEPMRRIFAEIYNVKRLQPGEIAGAAVDTFEIFHDCSTLGGNSGSPVIDLETHRVIGLHFGGRYMERNHAVPLWAIKDDPLIKKAKLNYQ